MAERTTPRLLLVDDDLLVISALQRTLRRGPWEILTANDGEAGLKAFEANRPEVVIADYRMPRMDGVQLLHKVKELAPRTERILLTGQAEQSAIERAINSSEIHRLIFKPWNDDQLYSTVVAATEHYALVADNERLYALTQKQNEELRDLNADLEQRVSLRTVQLVNAKREWEAAFDTIEQPLALVQTTDLRVRRGNLAYARAAGKSIHALAEKPHCYRYLFDRDAPCEGCSLASGATDKPAVAHIQHQDRHYQLSVYPMAQKVAVCAYRDTTDERQMIQRSIETEKMVAVGNLAGGVAHEINNPLGCILAVAQMMRRENGRTPEDVEWLGQIEESVVRCKRIVESLLKFSRKSRNTDRRAFDLSRCVEDASLLFRAQLKGFPNVALESVFERNLPEVYGDAGQLTQVVFNLLQNGLQALPQAKGRLTVQTGRRGEHCFLSVTDTGSGIPAENLQRIFEPHFTTKAPGEGTGLGLAIAYRIVEEHGGRFEVTSELGKGSRFTVLIPIPTRQP